MKPQFEPILGEHSNSLKAVYFAKRDFVFPYHYHPEYELLLILSSRGMRYVGTSIEPYEEMDFVLLGPGLPHCWKNETPAETTSLLLVQWKQDLLNNELLSNKEFSRIKKLLERSSSGVKFDHQVTQESKVFIERMLDSDPLEKISLLISLLNRLASEEQFTLLSLENKPENWNNIPESRIGKIIAYVNQNLKKKITLSSAAAQVNMTEQTFCRFFSKSFGKNFFTYVNEIRIERACSLLIQKDIQITSIPSLVGYDNYSFFFRQFKKFKSCSPQQFRIQHLKSTRGEIT